MNIKGKRIALYVRVSTDEQVKAGESIDDQLAYLRKWSQEHKCIVVDEYIDAGFSANKSYKTRHELCRLLNDVTFGRIDIVVFTKLDRWSRKTSDYYKLQEILEKHNVTWIAALENYDTESSDGRLRVGIMLSVNQHEAERTSDRIKFTFAEKRKRGELISGHMPTGYIIKDGKPVFDPEKYEGMKTVWNSFLEGKSISQVYDIAIANGINYSSMTTLAQMRRNAMAYAGNIQGIKCDAYITEEQAQLILNSVRHSPKGKNTTYLFSGMIKCPECGRILNGRINYSSKNHSKKNYFCMQGYVRKLHDTKAISISECKIEAQLLENLEEIFGNHLMKIESEQNKDDLAKINERIKKLDAQKNKILNLYLEELITKDEFSAKKSEIENEVDQLNNQLNKSKKSPEELRKLLPVTWKELYSNFDYETKRAFWFNLIGEITINSDRSINFTINI